MQNHAILKGKEVVPVSLDEWDRWFARANRVVAHTVIGDARVSTVFLGLNHQHGDGPPLWFETMVFGGKFDGDIQRYTTWAQAELGHMEWVEDLERRIIQPDALSRT